MSKKILRVLLEKISLERKLPINIKEDDFELFQKEKHYTHNEVELIEYSNVNLTPHGIIFEKFHIYEQSYVWPYFKKEYNWIYLIKNYLKRKKITLDTKKRYIVCFDSWSNGYYHWMSDFLPRLFLVLEFLKDENAQLIIPDFLHSEYMKETLRIFGIKDDKILRFDTNSYLSIPHLLVPDRLTPSGEHNFEITQEMRALFINEIGKIISSQKKIDKIFVSRSKAKYRKVVNEDELLVIFKKYNYEIICFEDYTFIEQVQLMLNVNVIVGLHGANLTNALFMNKNSVIFELRLNDKGNNNCYYSLSNVVGADYFYEVCEIIPSSSSDIFPDVYVDPVRMEKVLIEIENHLLPKSNN